jgi:hypothetical protein
VVQRRGGIETLESPPLRIMTNWYVDLSYLRN